MPIRVIKLSKGKKDRLIMEPGIAYGPNSLRAGNEELYVTQSSWMSGPGFSEVKGFCGTVYDTGEIDSLLSKIKSDIKKNRSDVNQEISDSLLELKDEIRKMKHAVINDTQFRESIKQDVIRELKRNELVEE